MLKEYPFGTKVLLSGINDEVDGEYIVKDKLAAGVWIKSKKTGKKYFYKFRNRIDILVKPGKLAGVWKARIKKLN
jgi:hypothetical protein